MTFHTETAFPDFHEEARVWVYPSHRELKEEEETELRQALKEFTLNWTSHQRQVKADFQIIAHQFIVIVADEEEESVSGCGIDKSVHFLKHFGQVHDIDFFNRLQLHFIQGQKILQVSLPECKEMLKQGKSFPGERVLFHGVSRLGHFRSEWVQSSEQSFLKNFMPAYHKM